ncbi:hypothetical protein Fmac_002004 [Flemingia macrophylla]|uniref:Membrane-associated kinase regulator 2 n=1 Tax=Flemingia macrophylla TaxID=520843 RepID=A0ABD1NIP8_9FABA
MEAFTLLKYWRGGGALGLSPSSVGAASRAATTTTTILTDDEDDEGPFFDLEFTLPDENQNANHTEEEEEESDGEREFKLTLSPSTNGNGNGNGNSNGNDRSDPKPQLTGSLLKSARVFMLGLRKPKPSEAEAQKEKKLFTVKLKVEEVPIVSLLGSNSKAKKQASEAEDKQRFSKETMQKYFKMVKPLYVRVSRRSAAKLQPTHNNNTAQTRFTVVCKHLGKSRSASSAAVAAAPPSPFLSSERRDDSLLQQQDGIQGAILHCKRSFNASTPDPCESSQLPRCVSQPSLQISVNETKDNQLST